MEPSRSARTAWRLYLPRCITKQNDSAPRFIVSESLSNLGTSFKTRPAVSNTVDSLIFPTPSYNVYSLTTSEPGERFQQCPLLCKGRHDPLHEPLQSRPSQQLTPSKSSDASFVISCACKRPVPPAMVWMKTVTPALTLYAYVIWVSVDNI